MKTLKDFTSELASKKTEGKGKKVDFSTFKTITPNFNNGDVVAIDEVLAVPNKQETRTYNTLYCVNLTQERVIKIGLDNLNQPSYSFHEKKEIARDESCELVKFWRALCNAKTETAWNKVVSEFKKSTYKIKATRESGLWLYKWTKA